MKKFHLALSVRSIKESVSDYSLRIGKEPDVVIPEQYALWRTDSLNFSIRQEPQKTGQLRHLGWEDDKAKSFNGSHDVNTVFWEQFSADQQAAEIKNLWPETEYTPKS